MSKNIIVVSHLDDETLWCSSLPLTYPGDWTCLSCSIPGSHSVERVKSFYKSCKILGIKPLIIPIPEEKEYPLELDLPNLNSWDNIITHGEYGEYGNDHHKQVHHYIKDNYPNKNKIYFGYNSSLNDDNIIKINEHHVNLKMAAIKCYDHGNPPYYKTILNWYNKLPNMKFDIETFNGDLNELA